MYQMIERDFGSIVAETEHRFSAEHAFDVNTVETAHEFLFFPNLDTVSVAHLMECEIGV